jgi:hypothetical protein
MGGDTAEMSESENARNDVVDQGVEFYANASWLRTTIIGAAGAVGLILPVVPAVVGAVDVALTTRAQHISQRRLNVLCQSWEQEMQAIPTTFVDKQYVESEEFFDLVFQAWESTKRTRHDEKIRLYAKLLVGAIPLQSREQDSPEDYLTVLAELSLKELQVARALYKQQREAPAPDENELQWLSRIGAVNLADKGENYNNGCGQWKKLLIECPLVADEDMEFVLLRLQRSGLVNEVSGAYWDYVGGAYVINNTLRKLMHYLERAHTEPLQQL